MTERTTLYYTFGNHMHWVDMEWLWGYHVLPGSVRDMLHFCAQSGAKGNVNFDGIGYEKLAAEAPDALEALRCAIRDGRIEVVGASYGQPYGLFHGGESNVRQRVYGVRTVMRLLGTRPRTFWEEEFDFFPQLPQMLCGVGYRYACLFFQWTWHTPAVPLEPTPVIWWEGMDGSRLLTASRNALNVHQWPEDLETLLESDAWRRMTQPALIQWLELMPSPDWMCRSEVLLPTLRRLLAHPALELRMATLSEYLEPAHASIGEAEVRRYTLDDVFHGMSLGKNADRLRRLSRESEGRLLTAESLSAMVGLFGRPYPSWDVYPTWELEEAWRELLSAQHHDNDECEGLCGTIGEQSYRRCLGLAETVIQRTLRALGARLSGAFAYNPLGWTRDVAVRDPQSRREIVVRDVPPFGYRMITPADRCSLPDVEIVREGDSFALRRGSLSVRVDTTSGTITQIHSAEFPQGMLKPGRPLGRLEMIRAGQAERFERAEVAVETPPHAPPHIRITRSSQDGCTIHIVVSLAPTCNAVDISYASSALTRPDGRMHAALRTLLAFDLPDYRLIHDHPYGLSEIRAQGTYLKKYPTGDWMTSPQVFEEVRNPFTALQLLDFDAGERGVLLLHDGNQAFLRNGDEVQHILSMYDPWDEDFFYAELHAHTRLIPHRKLTHAQRWRLAQEFTRPGLAAHGTAATAALLEAFGPLWCDADNVTVSAFYREEPAGGPGAYPELGPRPPIAYPYIVRLVELNGQPTPARLYLPGQVAAAYKTNLLGEIQAELPVIPSKRSFPGLDTWSVIAVDMRPFEIATVYVDIVLGRKIARDLDSYRSVWATAHRVDQPSHP